MSKVIETKEFIRYEVCIQGVFGRNRKAKSMYVELAEYPKLATYEGTEYPMQATHARLQELVQAALADNKVKPGAKWHVVTFPVTRDIYDDGVELDKISLALNRSALISGIVEK